MSCDNNIHLCLIESEYIDCPFCNQKIGEQLVNNDNCCDNLDIIYDNGVVCRNCGCFYGYKYDNGFIDFNIMKYRINKKSIYHRKYHLFNKIDNLLYDKMQCKISYNDKDKIRRIFLEIEKILPMINKNRKRLININFLFKKYSNC